MSLEDFYKNAISKTNGNYLQLNDQSSGIDITNFCFYSKGKSVQVKGGGFSLSMAIDSLRKALSDQNQDETSQKKNSSSILSFLNDNPILQSLKNILCCMKIVESAFGLGQELTDFPYMELCYIITNFNNVEIVISAIECLKYSLRFNSDSIPTKVTQETIISLSNLMNNQELTLCQSAIQIIGFLNQSSPELCDYFCSVGFFATLEHHIPKHFAIYVINQSIWTSNDENSLKFLFLLCESALRTGDELVYKSLFDGINIFLTRFTSIPDQLSAEDIISNKVINCKQLLFSLIHKYLPYANNYDAVLSMMKFCLFVPQEDPPNILDCLLKYLKDQLFLSEDPNLVINISKVIIHFYQSWKNAIPRTFLAELYNLITDYSLDYHTSFAYAKLIVIYHEVLCDNFDICVIELCTHYVCCPNELFANMCLKKILCIIESFSINNKLNEIATSSFEILNRAHDNLQELLDDLELNNDDEKKILLILNELVRLGIQNKMKT